MRSIKILGLAFVAMLALSAVGAGSASALLFLTSGAASELFTVNEAAETKLETLGSNTVTCQSTLADGTILNNTDVADKVLFTFHKCTTGLAGECTSAGETKGLIMTRALKGLLVTLSNGKYGLALSPESGTVEAEFKCKGLVEVAIKVTGGVVGEFTGNPEEASTTHEISFRKKGTEKGMQEWTAFETSGGGTGSAHLTTEITGATKETAESSEEGHGIAKTTNATKVCRS